MKRFLLLMMLLSVPAFGADPARKAAEPAEDPAAEAAQDEETVQTPFGRVKKQAPAPRPKPKPGATAAMVTVVVTDGVATFKRQTPFGVQSWKTPVDELSPAEKTLLEDSQAVAKPAAKPAPAPAPKPAADPR